MGRYSDLYLKEQQAKLGQTQVQQPVVTQPIKSQAQERGFSLMNPVRDISSGIASAIHMIPEMAKEFVQSGIKNFTPGTGGLSNTPGAILRGVGTGLVDLMPSIAGLGVDLINSVAGKNVINMPEERRRPLGYFLEQERDLHNLENQMATSNVPGLPEYKAVNPAMSYLVGSNPGAENAQFVEGLAHFAAPMGAVGTGVRGTQIANDAARIASKLNDAQKIKYANQINKLAAKNINNAGKNTPQSLGRMTAMNTGVGAGLGSLEGNDLQERAQNAMGGAAFGLGGSLVHGGLKKAGNSKLGKQVGKSAEDFIYNTTEAFPKFGRFLAGTDTALNTNFTKYANEEAKIRKDVYKRIAEGNNAQKSLDKETLDVIEAAKKFTPEQQKELFNRLKVGNKEYAENETRKSKPTLEDYSEMSRDDFERNYGEQKEQTISSNKQDIEKTVEDILEEKLENNPKYKNVKQEDNKIVGEVVDQPKEFISPEEFDTEALKNNPNYKNVKIKDGKITGKIDTKKKKDKYKTDDVSGLFIDEIIDPITHKPRKAININERYFEDEGEHHEAGQKYTGAESIEGFRAKSYPQGKAEGSDYSNRLYRRNGYTKLDNPKYLPEGEKNPEIEAENRRIMDDWKRRKEEKEHSAHITDKDIRDEIEQEFQGRNDALKDAVFYLENGKRINPIEPKSGKIKNGYEVVRRNSDGSFVVRGRSERGQMVQESQRKEQYARQQREAEYNDWQDYLENERNAYENEQKPYKVSDEKKDEGYERNKDDYENTLEYEEGVNVEDGVNNDYIKEGYHIEEPTGDGRYVNANNRTETMRDRFIDKIYTKAKNIIDKHPERTKQVYGWLKSKLSNKEYENVREKLTEEWLIDAESKKPRQVGDEYSEYEKAIKKDTEHLKSVSEDAKNDIVEREYDSETTHKGEEVLAKEYKSLLDVRDQYKTHKELTKNFVEGNRANVFADYIVKRGNGDLHKEVYLSPQELYDRIYNNIKDNTKLEDTTKTYVIDKLNKAIKERDVNNTVNTKDSYSVTNKARKSGEIENLRQAVEDKDIDEINKILQRNNHKLHNTKGLTEAEKDIISDAYALKARRTIDRVKNVDKLVEDEIKRVREAGGKETDYAIEARVRRQLKKEADIMKNIIRNYLTDFSLREQNIYTETDVLTRRTTGQTSKLESTGDVWNKDASDARQVTLEKTMRELEKALYDQKTEILDKYYNEYQSEHWDIVSGGKEFDKLTNEINKYKKELYEAEHKKISFLDRKNYKANQENIKELKKEINKLEKERNKVEVKEEYHPEVKAGYDFDKIDKRIKELNEGVKEFDKRTLEDYNALAEGTRSWAKTKWIDDALSAKDKINSGRKKEVTVKEYNAYKRAQQLIKDAEFPILDGALGRLTKYVKNKENQQPFKIGERIAKGERELSELRYVKEDGHLETLKGFVKGLTERSKDNVNRYIDIVKEFAKTGRHTGFNDLSVNVKNGLVSAKIKEHVQTTVNVRNLFDILPVSDMSRDTLSLLTSALKDDTIAITDRVKPNVNGATSQNGIVSYVVNDGRSNLEILRTIIHETVHRYLRANKNNPEALEEFGLTKEDILENQRLSQQRHDFQEGEGKPLFDFQKEFEKKNGREAEYDELPDDLKVLDDKKVQINKETWFNSNEEKVCKAISEKIVKEIEDDNFRRPMEQPNSRTTEGISDSDGSNTDGVSGGRSWNDISGSKKKPSSSNGLAEKSAGVKRFEQLMQSEGKDFNEAFNSLTDAEKADVQSYWESIKNNEIKFVNEINADFNKKGYKRLKEPKGDIKRAYDLEYKHSKGIEDFLIENGIPKGKLLNRLLKQSKYGEGVYIRQGRNRNELIDLSRKEKSEKIGLTGKKELEGLNQKGTAAQRILRGAETYARAQYIKGTIDVLKKNFSTQKEGTIPVNSKLLSLTTFYGKPKALYETISNGKEAIKSIFSEENAKAYSELFDQVKADKADLYLPKDVLDMFIRSYDRTLALDYIKVFGKQPGTKNWWKGLGKSTNALVDWGIDRFKRRVLTSSTFILNNRIGNQLMLLASAMHNGHPGDYFKGIADALRLKDAEVPQEILESTLAESIKNEQIGARRYFSEKDNLFDNFSRIINGDRIDLKTVKNPIKKTLAAASNIFISYPERFATFLSRLNGEINNYSERFERKQAFSQKLTQSQRNKINKLGRRIIGIHELAKLAEKEPALRQTVIDGVADILGDYNNFSPFEQNVMRKLRPFYSWDRTIIRNAVNLAKDNPTMALMVMYEAFKIKHNLEENYQYGALKLPIKNKRTGENIGINKARIIPWVSIAEASSPDTINSFNDALMTPIEAARGEKFFNGEKEITSYRYKKMTKDGVSGYYDRKTGKFKPGKLPAGARAAYVFNNLVTKNIFTLPNMQLTKGIPQGIYHKIKYGDFLMPDKYYDTDPFGYWSGDEIGRVNSKKKTRNAVNRLDAEYQVANTLFGGSLQPIHEKKNEKLKERTQKYKNKYKRK